MLSSAVPAQNSISCEIRGLRQVRCDEMHELSTRLRYERHLRQRSVTKTGCVPSETSPSQSTEYKGFRRDWLPERGGTPLRHPVWHVSLPVGEAMKSARGARITRGRGLGECHRPRLRAKVAQNSLFAILACPSLGWIADPFILCARSRFPRAHEHTKESSRSSTSLSGK